uniref:Transposable element P transposase-like RNase H C-terminal domain-containing protein n=1 Tax=Phlebotomus papatasi TaxID=29031 RepID=A0A1B0CZ70_PHLPP
MGFIGIIICLKNLPHMYREVKQDLTGGMKTYMLNQDHIELFFGSIRTRLGANTNPSVLQFRSAYKRLLTYVQLEKRLDGTNCLASLDDIVVLKVNTSRSLDYINNDVKDENKCMLQHQ